MLKIIRMSLQNISIILIRTKHPGNLGSAARAMFNMGIDHLTLVAPQCTINDESYRLAKGGKNILDSARTCRSLKSALRGLRFVVGTTGKSGGYRAAARSLRSFAPRIIDYAARQKVGIIFGPEDTGLTDDDLRFCQALIRIPTHRRGPSINLAQAVMLVCYELYTASLARDPSPVPKLAPVQQVEAMYDQLQESLLKIGFLQPQNARHMMFALRRMLGRAGLESSDVGILRGIARQIAWYAGAARACETLSS